MLLGVFLFHFILYSVSRKLILLFVNVHYNKSNDNYQHLLLEKQGRFKEHNTHVLYAFLGLVYLINVSRSKVGLQSISVWAFLSLIRMTAFKIFF